MINDPPRAEDLAGASAEVRSNDRTTVLLADDHVLLGVGITALLEAAGDLVMVGHALDGGQAVDMAQRLRPNVILMDLSMPTMDGVVATRLINASLPATRILILTSLSDSARVHDALQAGAIGCLLKDCDPALLVDSIRAAARGLSRLDPRVVPNLLPPSRMPGLAQAFWKVRLNPHWTPAGRGLLGRG